MMPYEITLGGLPPKVVDAVRHGESATVAIDGRDHIATLRQGGGGQHLVLEGATVPMHVVVRGDLVLVHAFGRSWSLELVDPVERARVGGPSSDVMTAPMPGTVVAVRVGAGREVSHGEVIIVIESMKMQSEIVAPREGTIAAVHVAVGESFDRGAPLAALEPDPDTNPEGE